MPESGPPRKAIRPATLAVMLIVAVVALAVGVWAAPSLRNAWHNVAQGPEKSTVADGEGTQGKTQWYISGMHPWIIEPRPGQCPICNMDLTPLDPARFSREIVIDPVVVQNIGVRIGEVTRGPAQRSVRTVGNVVADERTVRDVNIKVGGWIEKLHVDSEGQRVEAGQPLFDIYSPQLFAAQEEYLLAWRGRDRVDATILPQAAADARELVESARIKLEYLDINEKQIAALQETGKPEKTLTIRSPHEGIVIAKHANEGMKVEPGMLVFRIADLSKVWVQATIYEYQLPFVTQGQSATVTLPHDDGTRLEGRVDYIYPYLAERSREVKVRLEFDNAHGQLKPGMFVEIHLHATAQEHATLAPVEAVVDTGRRKVAFVSLGEGRFEPRTVEVGATTDDGRIVIVKGLEAGEKVVTSGQFLIDSESRMREALVKLMEGTPAQASEDMPEDSPAKIPVKPSAEPPAVDHSGH